jgi:hypothetical protein
VNLRRKLGAWRDANLITAEQVRAIEAFEESRGGSRNWIVLALGGVGVLAVISGLVSLIAANWNEIPAGAKLAAMFALLVGSLAAAERLSTDHGTLASDLCLAAHAGLVLAMIGLVGQVYQLSGAPWRALALAAALAIPAAVISRRSLLTDIAIAYALIGVWLFVTERGAFRYLEGMGWILLGACIGGALLLLGEALRKLHRPATRALRRWGGGLLFLAATSAAFGWSFSWSQRTEVAMMIWAAAVAAAWMVRLGWTRNAPLAGAALATTALILGAALLGNRPSQDWHGLDAPTRFLGFALFCAAGAAFAIGAARAGSRRLTNLFTLAIAARVVILYLEVIRTLALTGAGLLVTGAVFCGVAWAWWRLHAVLPVKEAQP